MPNTSYKPQEIEPKWQRIWEKEKCFKVIEKKDVKKYYLLEMLPYPSGRIHMGHVRNYCIGDVATRYRMMKGFKVLHPMGWDAFGMPAENAAIERKIHPAKWTYENIDHMREQMKRLGFSYDWEREFATCDPTYYKWEQMIFVRMFEKGSVYKKKSLINWCKSCQTVLANEQVVGGRCWRCDMPVELRSMSQWYFRITDYAEELLRDIDEKLSGWPERVRIMQKEWIGKSHGAEIDFKIDGRSDRIRIFTTRPDTLYGATFMSLAYEHPLVLELARENGKEAQVLAFIEKASHIEHKARIEDTYEKDGVFVGSYCINPVTGWKIPIYAANFVLMEYGTGAVMAVPAHDQRDFEFAKKYDLPIKVVIQPEGQGLTDSTLYSAWEGEGALVNSGEFSGMPSSEAIGAISNHLKNKGIGGPTVTYRLKDWCISRQRYWGAPIPIIYCDKCGTIPVPEKDLPVMLPQDVELTGTGGAPLSHCESFMNTKCPKCKADAKREADTMDTFVESSWYMFRYTSPKYNKNLFDKAKIHYWLPVDQYIGGIEHAVGHLIYCRYFTKLLRDLGLLNLDEPVNNLMTQGMVYKDGAKMSKSKGNVVDPDDMIEKYGADTVRLFSLFASPPEKDLEWSDQGIEGSNRFLQRTWRLVQIWLGEKVNPKSSEDELRLRHRTIKRVTEDIERYHFNTAISAIMEYVNFLYEKGAKDISKDSIETLIILISPFAPHAADDLWQQMGHKEIILSLEWPRYDPSKVLSRTMTLVVQVNGKLRDRLEVPADVSDDDLKAKALSSDKVKAHIGVKKPLKVIVVPKKLVNIVT